MEKQEPLSHDTANIPTNGQAHPANLSSNLTLFWRVFLPVFGTVFFTGLLIALWITTEEDLYLPYSVWWPRLIALSVWLGWLFYVRRALWPLKRVDADDAHIYVTNYWLTVRYLWTDVERLEEKKRLGWRVAQIHLKAPGRFGKMIAFLPGSRYHAWLEEHEKGYLLGEN